MLEAVMEIAVGVFIIVLGIFNAKGNISMLHSYHRKRVQEDDVLPFGKKVGAGSIIIGLTIIIAAITDLLSLNVASIVLVIGFIPGVAMIVYALMKYNKGIF